MNGGGDEEPVLVLRALGLGDGLTGIPALRGLRRALPGRPLVLAAPAGIGGWLRRLGAVDDVIELPDLEDLPAMDWAGRYGAPPDLAVDLHGCGPRSQDLLTLHRPRRLVSFRCPASGRLDGPGWDQDENEVHRWCRLVRHAFGAPCGPEDLLLPPPGPPPLGPPGYVVVHPGAAAESRRWPPERFAQLVAALVARGLRVVLTGDAAERERCAGIAAGGASSAVTDLSGRLDLDGLAAVVAGAGLVISGDTGVAHLATAYRRPSVLLFGPTPPHRWGPAVDTDLHRVLWHGSQLAPGYVGDPHGATVDPALALVTVDEVWTAAAGLLDRPPVAR
jgi:ADP-heptose:LPS heptosyltransferase